MINSEERLKQNTVHRQTRSDSTTVYPLTGLIRCPDCGKNIYGYTAPPRKKKNGKEGFYFVQNNVVGIDALECLISAEQIMRDYLLGKRTDIGNIENHIFFFDQVMSMSGSENGMSVEEARPNETIHRSILSYTVCYEELRTYVTFTNMMGIILLTFYSKGAEEQSSGTQIYNGTGTIVAKNQGLVSAVGNELSYLMQQAKEASENMSEAQKQKTIERLKKSGEDFLNSAAYKDWESDKKIKKSCSQFQ